jgi:hypothetical protein
MADTLNPHITINKNNKMYSKPLDKPSPSFWSLSLHMNNLFYQDY